MKNTFPKTERLFGVKRIERLHTQGEAFIIYPFRIVFIVGNDESETIPVRAMVSVSKKKFRNAVDRNRIKRLMREVYRLNKSSLISNIAENRQQIHLAFQYISDEILPFSDMNYRMQKALGKLIKKISDKTESLHADN